MVASLPVSREEILLELTPNKMDPEAGIRMPEDRDPDSLVGRAHWADVSQSDPALRRKYEFRSVIRSGSFDLGAIHRNLSRDGGAAGAECHRPFIFEKSG
jgi:hypothetical protein